ncbi:MAG: DUF2273 domain-containing protein [Bacillota bacterium]
MNYQELFERHRGKIIGIVLGLAFGWFAIVYGFWKALFVAACVAAGYFIGKRIDERVKLGSFLDNLFREK